MVYETHQVRQLTGKEESIMRVKAILGLLALFVLLCALHTQATTRYANPRVKSIAAVAKANPEPFSCSCSCNGGEANCSGHCQIFATCDSAAECFFCVSDCCRSLLLQ